MLKIYFGKTLGLMGIINCSADEKINIPFRIEQQSAYGGNAVDFGFITIIGIASLQEISCALENHSDSYDALCHQFNAFNPPNRRYVTALIIESDLKRLSQI